MKVSKFFESLRVVVNSEEENVQLRWIYGIAIISVLLNLTLYGWKTLADSGGIYRCLECIYIR